MALTDYKSAVHLRLWTLLEAEPEVTRRVLTGNRQKFTGKRGWLRDLFTGRMTNDFPAVKIANGRFTNSAFTEDVTFAAEREDFLATDGGWPLTRRAEFAVTVTSRTLEIGAQDELEEAVQQALLKGGPRLGLEYVTRWDLEGRQEVTDRDEAKGTHRLVTKLTVRVTMQWDGTHFVRT